MKRALFRPLARYSKSIVFCASVLLPATISHAQGHATFLGVILSDSASVPLANAEVAIPSLRLSSHTDTTGKFRIENITPGEYDIVVRKMGYAPLRTRVEFESDETSAQQFQLTSSPPLLAKVKVVAPDTARSLYVDNIAAFELRRRHGFGNFIGADDLQAARDQRLSTVLRSIPTLKFYRYGGSLIVGSSQTDRRCPSQVYYDGVKVNAPFDIESVNPSSLRGIEFYPANSSAPGPFPATPGYCGVLVVWTMVRR